MAKTKLLGASALTSLALLLVSCTGTTETEAVKTADPSAVETLVTEAATRPGSELMAASQQQNDAPTVQEAKEFLEDSEEELAGFNAYAAKVYWIKANFITEDTAALGHVSVKNLQKCRPVCRTMQNDLKILPCPPT